MSLSITKEGMILIRAPKKLSIEKILAFVNEKENWIKKHLSKISIRKR